MPEEFTPPSSGPTYQQHPPYQQDRQEIFRKYGPPTLGVIIVLLLLSTGWYLFRTKTQANKQLVSSVAPSSTLKSSPTGQPILTNQTPLPKSSSTPQPTTTPSPNTTKGGQPTQLPKTGFPLGIIALGSGAAVLVGWKLRRLTQ